MCACASAIQPAQDDRDWKGWVPHPAHGVASSRRLFQQRSRNTLARAMSGGGTMPPVTISEGSEGPVVSWAQYLLVRRTLSYNQIDGIFGPVTKTAVEEFQGSNGLSVDGIVGPITWGASGRRWPRAAYPLPGLHWTSGRATPDRTQRGTRRFHSELQPGTRRRQRFRTHNGHRRQRRTTTGWNRS